MLLLAAGWRLTDPLMGVVPLLTLVEVAAARGDLAEGVQLQAGIERFTSAIAFTVPARSMARYDAATASLLSRTPVSERPRWSAIGASRDLSQTVDHALGYDVRPGFDRLHRTPGERRIGA